MAAFIKSLSRLLGSSSKPEPALYLAAFGKHPGWNDHLDDLGLDTDSLIAAKRLLYVQGISQNIDSGAWDKLEAATSDGLPAPDGASSAPPSAAVRLDLFRHDFLWHMRENGSSVMLAGRLWSSSDGKGRDKYPMVVCSQLTELPARFAVHVVLPLCARTHEQCASTTSADTVRRILDTERENLRSHIKDSISPAPLTARQVAAVASHSDMVGAADSGNSGNKPAGFHRIVYQFLSGLAMYRPASARSGTRSVSVPRPEQLRLPTCGMSADDALLFWLRFAFTLLDASTPLLLVAPDQPAAPWVDLIAGEPAPTNIFCIKAGTKSLPFTSDIPYTLDPSLVSAIDTHLAHCAGMPEDAPFPPWPAFS